MGKQTTSLCAAEKNTHENNLNSVIGNVSYVIILNLQIVKRFAVLLEVKFGFSDCSWMCYLDTEVRCLERQLNIKTFY